jgi:hypothetical protein
MNTRLVNIWTEETRTATSDQAVQKAKGELAQVGTDGGLDNDATNLDEPAKDPFWLYREAASGPRRRLLMQLVDRKTAVEVLPSGVVMEFDGRGCRVNK